MNRSIGNTWHEPIIFLVLFHTCLERYELQNEISIKENGALNEMETQKRTCCFNLAWPEMFVARVGGCEDEIGAADIDDRPSARQLILEED